MIRQVSPPEYCSADLTKFNFEAYKSRMENFRKIVTNFVNEFSRWEKQGKGLYLWSKTTGSGKTFLACCLARSLMMKYDLQMRFITAPDYISVVGDSYKRDRGEMDSSEVYRECKLLVLDDIGAQADKDWQRQELFRLINKRMEDGNVTIYTSNMSTDNLNVDARTQRQDYKSQCGITNAGRKFAEKESRNGTKRVFKRGIAVKKLRLKINGEQVKAVLIETDQLQQWKNEISAEVLEAVKSDLKKGLVADEQLSEKKISDILKRDRAIQNTQFILKGYRKIKQGCEKAILDRYQRAENYKESWKWFDSLMRNKDPDEFINELKSSSDRTADIIHTIDLIFDEYWQYCQRGDATNQRRYDVVFSLYIADEPLTMQSLAEAYKVSRVTIYNDKNKAVEELAERIFTTKI